jgi:predicted Zn-dependent protease with MMP-like domain
VIDISDEQFDQTISEVMDELPQEYIKRLNNVAIVYADEPTPAEREQLKLRCDQTLLGLYQGIPLTQRGAGYNLVLPDKITLFKGPLLRQSNNLVNFRAHVKHTLWHEIAHFFGLDHERIHRLERKGQSDGR